MAVQESHGVPGREVAEENEGDGGHVQAAIEAKLVNRNMMKHNMMIQL